MAFTEAQLAAGSAYALDRYTSYWGMTATYPNAYARLTMEGAEPAETREQRIARETKALLRQNMIGTGLLLAAGLTALAAVAQFAGWLP